MRRLAGAATRWCSSEPRPIGPASRAARGCRRAAPAARMRNERCGQVGARVPPASQRARRRPSRHGIRASRTRSPPRLSDAAQPRPAPPGAASTRTSAPACGCQQRQRQHDVAQVARSRDQSRSWSSTESPRTSAGLRRSTLAAGQELGDLGLGTNRPAAPPGTPPAESPPARPASSASSPPSASRAACASG